MDDFEPIHDPTETEDPRSWVTRALAFVLLLLIATACILYLAKDHERRTPDPKPTPVRADKTVWLQCNAGMEVTDLRNCPEYNMLDKKQAHE